MHQVMTKNANATDRGRPYAKLCDSVNGRGGKVRLGRSGRAFMLVVEDPISGASPRVAGYVFHDIAELDAHALLILTWLCGPRSRPPQLGGGVAGA